MTGASGMQTLNYGGQLEPVGALVVSMLFHGWTVSIPRTVHYSGGHWWASCKQYASAWLGGLILSLCLMVGVQAVISKCKYPWGESW